MSDYEKRPDAFTSTYFAGSSIRPLERKPELFASLTASSNSSATPVLSCEESNPAPMPEGMFGYCPFAVE